eukprot:GHVT01058552.1.p1 GENE.GHVT01058552.1~~GHVT01058552.1.p1  ORF type:complete len:265 (+),score=67.90 GHVT01058552.1:398-1192(+)
MLVCFILIAFGAVAPHLEGLCVCSPGQNLEGLVTSIMDGAESECLTMTCALDLPFLFAPGELAAVAFARHAQRRLHGFLNVDDFMQTSLAAVVKAEDVVTQRSNELKKGTNDQPGHHAGTPQLPNTAANTDDAAAAATDGQPLPPSSERYFKFCALRQAVEAGLEKIEKLAASFKTTAGQEEMGECLWKCVRVHEHYADGLDGQGGGAAARRERRSRRKHKKEKKRNRQETSQSRHAEPIENQEKAAEEHKEDGPSEAKVLKAS